MAKAKTTTAPKPAKPTTPAKITKLSLLVDLLKRKTGATIGEAVKATGWQAHSVRGAMSGTLKKKRGLAIESVPCPPSATIRQSGVV
jgi:hypothetical protein